jgi:hypothetical protein
MFFNHLGHGIAAEVAAALDRSHQGQPLVAALRKRSAAARSLPRAAPDSR